MAKVMVLSIYFLSLIFFMLGWIYYSKPGVIQNINNFFKNRIFNDRNILLKRKKIAIVFFIAACLLLTSGFIRALEEQNKKVLPVATVNHEIIFDLISIYIKHLSENPKDIAVLTKLAYAYEALGEKNRELLIWKRVLDLAPENEAAKKRLGIKL
jgi:tetratricopeptide (TPR) repeat protein